MKPVVTWVLIADGGSARFFSNEGPGKGLAALQPEEVRIDLPESREINADRPGRTHDSAGAGRHAMEPPSDPKEERKRVFLDTIAHGINAAAVAGEYDRLVVIAPPKALGELRAKLNDHAQKRIHAEMAKDLTNTPVADLPKQLEEVLAL